MAYCVKIKVRFACFDLRSSSQNKYVIYKYFTLDKIATLQVMEEFVKHTEDVALDKQTVSQIQKSV